MNSSVENFNENGFALFKNVLTTEEVAAFREECEKLVQQREIVSQGDNDYLRNNILMRSEVIRKIFLQDKIINIIKQVCDEEFCILPEVSIMRSTYGGWHKDTTSIDLFGYDFHKEKEFRVVNVAIYSQDNGDFGGGLDVVPGSHKTDDTFVEYYRKQASELKPHKSRLLDSLISGKDNLKGILKDFLRSNNLLPARYREREKTVKASYPLDSSDTRPNKYQIPSNGGDIVIFDLRLDHKASWPKREFDPKSIQTKYAFFAICGVNNAGTYKYKDYLMKRSETQEAYKYLQNYKASNDLQEFADKNHLHIL